MRLPELEIVTGEVKRVEYAVETPASKGRAPPKRARLAPRSTLNRMRVHILDEGGRERDASFLNSTVGVREGHRVSVVRAEAPGAKGALTVMLHNHSTGQRQELPGSLAQIVSQRAFPARLRALGAAVVVFGVFWVTHAAFASDESAHLSLAIVASVLSFPALWAAFAAFDRAILPRVEARLADRIRAEMDGRLRPLDASPQ